MSIVKLNPYRYLKDEHLIQFTIDEMNKLKLLSKADDYERYKRTTFIIGQLISEIKRRKLHLKKPQLAERIFLKE